MVAVAANATQLIGENRSRSRSRLSRATCLISGVFRNSNTARVRGRVFQPRHASNRSSFFNASNCSQITRRASTRDSKSRFASKLRTEITPAATATAARNTMPAATKPR